MTQFVKLVPWGLAPLKVQPLQEVWPCAYTAARKTPRKEHRCIAPLGSCEIQGDGLQGVGDRAQKGARALRVRSALVLGLVDRRKKKSFDALGLRAYPLWAQAAKWKQCKTQAADRSFLRTVLSAQGRRRLEARRLESRTTRGVRCNDAPY